MTIRNHQLLKDALLLTLNYYDKLPKGWYRFFSASGDTGKARAAFIRTQLDDLKNLHDINEQKKLEILFSSIIKSDIFSSVMGRLKKLLLKHILPDISDHNFSGNSMSNFGMSNTDVNQKNCSLKQKMSQNPFFTDLDKSICYEEGDYRCEGPNDADGNYNATCYWAKLHFSRTDALKGATDEIYVLEKDKIDQLTKRINNCKNQSDALGHINFEMAHK